MKWSVKIKLSKDYDDSFTAEIEALGSGEIANARSTKTACLQAADKLEELAAKFRKLAESDKPLSERKQAGINRLRASALMHKPKILWIDEPGLEQ